MQRFRRCSGVTAMLAVVLAGAPVDAAPSGGALPPALTLVISVAGRNGVPDDAVGVAVNVTVTNPVAPGFLVVYPCGQRPEASNLNYTTDQTVPNLVLSRLDDHGNICVDTMATTDVVIDIAGYVPAGSPLTPLPAPQRFVDTRSGLGAPHRRVAGGSVLEVTMAGRLGVPDDTGSLIVNTTAVQPAASGFLTVFPCGQSIPQTSTLNFTAGSIVPNLAVVAPDSAGRVCIFSNVDTDVVVDVAAYAAGDSVGITTLGRPQRLVDTRTGLGGPRSPVTANSRVVAIGGQAGVPLDASAAIVNLTATDATGDGYAAAFPCGATVPVVSNLNFTAGSSVANLAIVALAPDGTMCAIANRSVDVVVDVLGYISGTTAFAPMAPQRIYDSREGVDPGCSLGVRQTGTAFQLVDLVSGSITPTLTQVPPYEEPARAWVGPDCRVRIVGSIGGHVSSVELGPSGALLDHDPLVPGLAPIDVASTDMGLIGLRDDGAVAPQIIDAVSGAVLFDLPPTTTHAPDGSPDRWSLVGATLDRSMIATARITDDRLGRDVFVWSSNGTLLRSFGSPGSVGFLELSPRGRYVASADLVGIRRFEVTITTTTGAPVATIAAGPDIEFLSHPTFITDGSMLVCSPTSRLLVPGVAQRWDVFTAPRPFVVGDPDLPCLLAAG